MNMRIVFTAPRYHTNQRSAMKALIEAGHEVSFLALTRGQSEEYSALSPTVLGYSRAYDLARRLLGKLAGKDFVGVPPGGGIPAGGIPPAIKFLNRIRRMNPDVVVIRDPHSQYGRLSILAAKLTGTTIVLYTQIPLNQLAKERSQEHKTLRRRILYWITSDSQWMTPVLGPSDTPPGMPGLNYVPFVTEPQTCPSGKRWFRRDAINILAIGKYQRRKNHRLFLQVLTRLSERHPIQATIIGECSTPDHRRELESVERYRDSLGLRDKVAIKTNLPFSQVQREYREHDVFVLASSDEPAAVSPLEAMSHSLPVVCSDSNGTMCYIRQGENGFVFRADDADHLELCLDKILTDRKRLMRMGRRSHELVISEHSPKRYVEALERMASGKI